MANNVTLFRSKLCVKRSEVIGFRGHKTDQEVVDKGLVGPGVVEGCGQVHIPIQNDQQRTTETEE